MLRKIICALLFCLEILFSNNIKAQQNLVPNPSFEDTLLISGQNFYLEHHITNWNGGRGYFNANQVGSFGSVPSNDVGYQYPRTANAYCGIYTYAKYTSPIRQYIQTKLKQNLVYNKIYKVSFYVSLLFVVFFAVTFFFDTTFFFVATNDFFGGIFLYYILCNHSIYHFCCKGLTNNRIIPINIIFRDCD